MLDVSLTISQSHNLKKGIALFQRQSLPNIYYLFFTNLVASKALKYFLSSIRIEPASSMKLKRQRQGFQRL